MFFKEKTNNVIFTAYFTTIYDKNREFNTPKDDYNYMYPLYSSCKKLNLQLIIFYDDLSDDFVNKYTCDKIIFKKVDMKRWEDYEPHDIRIMVLEEYLRKNEFGYIFLTDIRDVYVNKDPFIIYRNNDNKNKLCLQQDVDETIGENIWANIIFCRIHNVDKIGKTILSKYVDKRLMNCGIIGGSYVMFYVFIERMAFKISELNKKNLKGIKDMMVVNYVYYKFYDESNTITGSDLHSPFHQNIISDKYYFSHK